MVPRPFVPFPLSIVTSTALRGNHNKNDFLQLCFPYEVYRCSTELRLTTKFNAKRANQINSVLSTLLPTTRPPSLFASIFLIMFSHFNFWQFFPHFTGTRHIHHSINCSTSFTWLGHSVIICLKGISLYLFISAPKNKFFFMNLTIYLYIYPYIFRVDCLIVKLTGNLDSFSEYEFLMHSSSRRY